MHRSNYSGGFLTTKVCLTCAYAGKCLLKFYYHVDWYAAHSFA